MLNLKKLLIRSLRSLAKDIENDNCEITESEAMDILSVINHQPMSKDQACEYLNLSRSKFDDLVREGKIPKGRKVKGFKELRWYKDEIQKVIK